MYRVFEALDELVTIVEEARGLPMTASCVVPRGDVLELLDDVREALPGEVDDAQDVLDHRDQLVADAGEQATRTVAEAQAEAERLVGTARVDADSTIAGARAEAERMVADATAHAESLVSHARDEAARIAQIAQEQHDGLLARAHAEADRLAVAGRASYEGAVADGRAEQARLVGQTEVVQVSHAEAARIIDAAHADADRMRADCDSYVDASLGHLEETLSTTLRTIGRGRTALRNGGVADYRDEPVGAGRVFAAR